MKIFFHLLKTDWQRFKWSAIAVWVGLVATALPWLLHPPGELPMLQTTSAGSNSELEEVPGAVWSWGGTSNSIFAGSMLVTLLAVILAARLGMQWVKQPVTPIRRRERLPALLASLLLFIILPLWMVIFLNLMSQGFTPGIAALAAGSQSGSALLLLGVVAAFAAWCPTVWQFLAGLAVLFSIGGFVRELRPGYHPPILGYFSSLLQLPAGPAPWLLGVLAIGLLATLLPICRGRLNAPLRIAAAVAIVLASALAVDRLPELTFPAPVIARNPPPGISAIRPRILEPRLEMDDSADDGVRLIAEFNSIDCPAGYEVEWREAGPGWISQNGERVGSKIERENRNEYISPEREAGYFIPLNDAAANLAAVATLSGGKRSLTDPRFETHYLSELGTFAFSKPLLADREAVLQADLIGTVYRYEVAWDVPLTERAVEKQIDGLSWNIRRYPSPTGKLRADVRVSHPALGVGADREKIRWDASPLEGGRFFFHLPESGVNIPAGESLASESGPMLAGAGWHRKILGPTRYGQQLDSSGLRLIRVTPVIVGRIHSTASVTFRPWLTRDGTDFDLIHRHPVEAGAYRRDWFAERPNPQTASREDFARWLRVAAGVYSGYSGSERDLAAFAPRFAGLMTKVGYHEAVADGLRLGTPESRRGEVLGQFDRVPYLSYLADKTLLRRGWLNEAREPLLRRFRNGELWNADAILALEDPSTYPELISRFISRPTQEDYEKLRLLPGIESLLHESIAKATRNSDPALLRAKLASSQSSAPYGTFLYAAKQGDATGLDAILSIYQSSDNKVDYATFRELGYVLSLPDLPDKSYQALTAWLHGKSAASFRFDPLLRLWHPLP
jgi:MFS family permease